MVSRLCSSSFVPVLFQTFLALKFHKTSKFQFAMLTKKLPWESAVKEVSWKFASINQKHFLDRGSVLVSQTSLSRWNWMVASRNVGCSKAWMGLNLLISKVREWSISKSFRCRHRTLPVAHIFSLCQFQALKLCKLGDVNSVSWKLPVCSWNSNTFSCVLNFFYRLHHVKAVSYITSVLGLF